MILEREHELGELSALLDGVTTAGGQVLLVRGEAGIGKSALVDRFAAEVSDRARVLTGWCDHLLTPQPFGAFWDVARHEPPLHRRLSAADGRGVMEALLALLSDRDRPTVLIIEDTQWADEATLDAIKFLGRRIARTNGILVLTYRDGEIDTDHPLRQVIGELPSQNLVRLPLRPLSATAITDLVAGQALDVEQVLALTGGNPLFVTEVLASGLDQVPSSVQESVLARTARLSATARRLLHLVSVVPGGVERQILERLTAFSIEDVRECVHQGLLVDGEPVAFRHELQRLAIETSLSTGKRRALNRAVLDELSDEVDPALLVHHAREAGDVDALLAHAPRAARAAVATGSQREAIAHFRALEDHMELLEPMGRAELLEDWARSEAAAGNPRAVELVSSAIDLRRALGNDVTLARCLTFAVGVYERNAMLAEAEACMTEALAILRARPPSEALAAALTQAGWLLFVKGTDDQRARELTEEAIRIAEEEDELLAIRAMTWNGAITHNMGDRDGFPLVEEAHQRAAKAGFRFEETIALVNLAAMSADVRQVARAADYVRRARETASRYEIGSLESYAQAMHAEILLWQGDWGAAEDTATAALDGPPHVSMIAWRVLGQLQARRGRDEALAILERVWSDAERSGELQQMDPAASVFAEHAWLADDRDERRLAIITSVVERGLDIGPPWPSGALVFWAWKLGLLAPVPPHTPDHFRAIIEGRPHVAASFWRSHGVPYEEALALMHGDEDDQLQALEILDELGAMATADQVRRGLRARGVRLTRGRSASTRSHPAGLTARQAEVLDLLAGGASNPDIADRLFISHSTVENHVAAVLMKLDSTDRHAAVERARELGLVGR